MKNRITVVGLAAIIVPFLIGCGVFQAVEEPSAPIEAVPLEVDEAEETAVPEEPTAEPTEIPAEDVEEVMEEPTDVPVEEPTDVPVEEPTDVPVEEPTDVPIEEPTAEPIEESTSEPVEESTSEPVEESAAPAGFVIYQISQDDSEVRFELDEDLGGRRITVIGTTDQVAGELGFDFADLSSTQVGVIQINARTLMTDNNFRNRAINNEILETGDHEFITFTPTGVEGLPESIVVGEAVDFSIVGTLTIRDITQDVTFTVEATAVSSTQITGTASTIISRADYELNIPSVPNVANVEEDVELYIDFTANANQ